MKNLCCFVISILFLINAYATKASVTSLDSNDQSPMFYLTSNFISEGENLRITAIFKDVNEVVALEEKAVINAKSAETITYSIDQRQTKEKGFVRVTDDKIKITYEVEGKPKKEIEIEKPSFLVTPGSFERWLQVNIESLKKEKTRRINFLVWDRFETIGFKVTYLGESEMSKQKVHEFKMNIDNFLIAAFVSPIRIWFSEDMKTMLRYKGRMGVKQVKGPELKNLDAEVVYFQDLKAAQ